ncbi:hypothetical protein Acr_01g0014200 [Actinidia rufa]|uniref:F-box domain-containing protein n=1 Tax=Actinidia rufa TaxID=165716 RepID=A0A7J0E540_9ERIC|nr:hypothetical protein Acr_01g0014200 [Actinidia rufa]
MSEPKWEDLDRDCLVSIFGRLGLESLLLDVPFVCKSWYKATRIPQSWRHLDFSKLQLHDSWYYDDFTSRLMDTYGIEALPELPNRCMEEALLYVADECPALRTLVLPSNVLQGPQGPQFKIKNHMSKWTNLQFLKLQRCFDMKELLTQINIHCKNFEALAIERANIGRDEASAIVKFLPKYKGVASKVCFHEKEEPNDDFEGL